MSESQIVKSKTADELESLVSTKCEVFSNMVSIVARFSPCFPSVACTGFSSAIRSSWTAPCGKHRLATATTFCVDVLSAFSDIVTVHLSFPDFYDEFTVQFVDPV